MRIVRALILSYAFPPVGGAGVQRVTKFVRYLPEFGVTPVVLTVENPSVPLRDETLLRELPSDLRVVRVPTLEPSYEAKRRAHDDGAFGGEGALKRLSRAGGKVARALLFPDPQILWLPNVVRRLSRWAREEPPFDVVFITAPPFSQLLLVPWLKRTFSVPVVIDYRDEWTTTLAQIHEDSRGRAALGLSDAIERRIVARADAVTMATEEYREELLRRMPQLAHAKVHCLTNGYDPSDFPARPAEPPLGRFVVTYAGTVFRLTSMTGFMAALRLLCSSIPR